MRTETILDRLRGVTRVFFLFIVFAPGFSASSAQAAPEVDLHELTWYVHVDLIEASPGRDLAFWQAEIDRLTNTANRLFEGAQGPFDTPCCTRLGASAPVATFGTPGDGLDVIDSLADQNAIAAMGTGSRAFLVDSTTYCSGSSPTAIGCAIRPSCNGNGDDDPNLWLYVTVDAFDSNTLAGVIAHERGHNACLQHISDDECQLMAATVLTPGLAGCLSASECTNIAAARTEIASGLECSCQADGGGLLADAMVCDEVTGGVCSGGLCGAIDGDAGVQLHVAGAPGDMGGLPPENLIRVSGLAGDWEDLGLIAPTADDVRGLAYAFDSGILYGVIPTTGDDRIVTIDVATGDLIATVGTIGNGAQEFVSMAYDPGDTSATTDDRLILLEVSGSSGEFRAIDPASPNTASLLGSLPFGSAGSFTGMAYDSLQDRLYLATPFGNNGLFQTDLTTCPPSPCTTTQLPGFGLFRDDASLGFSPATGMLYLVGTAEFDLGGGNIQIRTFYDIIDPAIGLTVETLSLDRFTPSALAAVPEPGLVMGVTAGLIGLVLTAARRTRS